MPMAAPSTWWPRTSGICILKSSAPIRSGIAFGGTSGQPTSGKFPNLPLYHDDGTPNTSMVAAYAALTGVTVNIADAYTAQGFDFSGTRKFDAGTGYRSRSFLTVPMRSTHEKEVIGVLQADQCRRP